MAIRAPVDQRQTRAVVVRRMALQTECRLAHAQQVLIRRPMRGVTCETALVHRSVLECEWPLVFSMAAEAKLVSVRGLQTVL